MQWDFSERVKSAGMEFTKEDEMNLKKKLRH